MYKPLRPPNEPLRLIEFLKDSYDELSEGNARTITVRNQLLCINFQTKDRGEVNISKEQNSEQNTAHDPVQNKPAPRFQPKWNNKVLFGNSVKFRIGQYRGVAADVVQVDNDDAVAKFVKAKSFVTDRKTIKDLIMLFFVSFCFHFHTKKHRMAKMKRKLFQKDEFLEHINYVFTFCLNVHVVKICQIK